MPNDVIEQVRRYLDYAAAESAEEPTAVPPSVREGRWYQRGPAVAVIAAVVVLAIGLPALLFGSGSESPSGSDLPDPLEVGVDHVWPESGFAGSPDEIAAEFAERALGWTNAATSSDPEAPSDGPVWTTIQYPGRENLDVLSIPIGDGRRVLVQVGLSVITAGSDDDGQGQWVGISPYPNAQSAHLHIRFVNPDRLEVVEARREELARGRVEIATNSPIGGVVIVYLDEAGDAMTAQGVHFGPLDNPQESEREPEAAGPEVTIAEGTYEGSAATWRMSAFKTTDGNLCIRLEGMGCVADIPAADHLGAVLATGSEAGDGARWCVYGPVKEADTVQIHLPDGTWSNTPIYTHQDFDVDFYAQCREGNQPATGVRALDTNGNVIHQVPAPDNG